jgi:tetratricopeptide (TPR) repeat protein
VTAEGPVPSALAALRSGQPQAAVDHLAPIVEAPELDDPEMLDVRARLCSLYAQALLQAGDAKTASIWVRKALRAASTLKDAAGLLEVRALQGEIVGALADAEAARRRAVEREHIAETSLEDLLAIATTPEDRAAVLAKKASSLAGLGSHAQAADLYDQSMRIADQHGILREQVFARLGMAAVHPDAAVWVQQAQRLAEAASEYTLLSTIAREADRLGVSLPAIDGPSGLRDFE